MSSVPLTESALPLPLIRRGKVREVYEVDDDTLLLVASDRVSAFDVVMDEPIPHKGAVLTQTSAYWFRELASVTPSHFISADADEIMERVPALADHRDSIAGRTTLARRTTPVPFECVVRGYVAGSAWKEYRESSGLGWLWAYLYNPTTHALTAYNPLTHEQRSVTDPEEVEKARKLLEKADK